MGSCSSVDENKIGSPVKPKDTPEESSNLINTYPSIEDVIRMEKLKKKKNSGHTRRKKLTLPRNKAAKFEAYFIRLLFDIN